LLDDEFDVKVFCKNYPKFEVAIKYYDFKLSELFAKTEDMIMYTQNMFNEYSMERKAVAMQLKNHPMFEIGMWSLDHRGGTAREFWLYNIHKLYRAIPKHEKVLIQDMNKANISATNPIKLQSDHVKHKGQEEAKIKNNIKNELWYSKVPNKPRSHNEHDVLR
jgi:hypothetical protein